MDTEAIVRQMQEKRDRISQAISLLQESGLRGKRRGRPKKRKLSAATRKKMSDAMKKRWAE